MAHSNKQKELKSTEEIVNMRRSFSWNRDFFTSDGFLDAEELSSMIEGSGGDDVKLQLQKIEEIDNLEAKLFQEIEASNKKSTGTSNASRSGINLSSGKKDSQAKKVAAARSSTSSKPNKVTAESPSKISAGITTKNKVVPVNTRVSRTPPASPGSSSSSTFSVNQWPKRSSSVPRKSSVNSEKPSANNARRNNEPKTMNKVGPVSNRMSRTPPASPGSSGSSSSSTFSVNQRSKRSSSVPRRSSLNNEKPSPTKKVASVNTGKSRTSPSSPVSSSTFSTNQRSKRCSSVPRRSSVNNEKPSETNARKNDEWKISKPEVRLIPKTQPSISLKIKPPPIISHPSMLAKPVGRSETTLKTRPTSQTQDRNGKQPAASDSKTRNLLAPKTAAAVNTGLKPGSQKTASRKQSSAKAKAKSASSVSRGAENIILVSPEVLDIKGKLNALKMEISMQKKDRCKETKMSHEESGKGESSSIIQMNKQTKSK